MKAGRLSDLAARYLLGHCTPHQSQTPEHIGARAGSRTLNLGIWSLQILRVSESLGQGVKCRGALHFNSSVQRAPVASTQHLSFAAVVGRRRHPVPFPAGARKLDDGS